MDGSTGMREGKVRQLGRCFENDSINLHEEERNCRPSMQTDEILKQVNREHRKDRQLTISEYPYVLRESISTIATEELESHKLFVTWV